MDRQQNHSLIIKKGDNNSQKYSLSEYLCHHTDACTYVKIRDPWLVAMCFIDYEDLFHSRMKSELLNRKVISTELIKDEDFTVPVLNVYIN